MKEQQHEVQYAGRDLLLLLKMRFKQLSPLSLSLDE
jgi:hypothetical protein